jgi:hypothetical protein
MTELRSRWQWQLGPLTAMLFLQLAAGLLKSTQAWRDYNGQREKAP